MQLVDDTEKFDVNSKHVVPPDGIEVLNLKPEMVCRVACDSTFHKATVLEVISFSAIILYTIKPVSGCNSTLLAVQKKHEKVTIPINHALCK